MADFNDNFINYSFERKTVSERSNLYFKDDVAFEKKNGRKKALGVLAGIVEVFALWI